MIALKGHMGRGLRGLAGFPREWLCGLPDSGVSAVVRLGVKSRGFHISNHITPVSLLTPLASGATLRGTSLALKPVCNQ